MSLLQQPAPPQEAFLPPPRASSAPVVPFTGCCSLFPTPKHLNGGIELGHPFTSWEGSAQATGMGWGWVRCGGEGR